MLKKGWRSPASDCGPEGHSGFDNRIDAVQGGTRIMDTDRKLGEVAANLDDISDTLEEIKDAVHEGGAPTEGTLDGLQQDVEDASDTIDDVVGQGQAPKLESGGECRKKGWS
jgi:hypothetical protein